MATSVGVPSPQTASFVQMSTPHLDSLRIPSEASVVEIGANHNVSVQHGMSLPFAKEETRRVLTTISIVGVCYFAVSGGPIGSEYIVSAGGPLIGFISLLLFPFIWGVPIAFITAELSSTFPEDGGYTVWVLNAFGPFWAFQTGYWSWISGVIDNAIYPALAVATFTDAYGSVGTAFEQYLLKAAIAIALALPNLFGIRIVGNGMAVLSLFVMVPFVVLSVWGAIRASDWGVFGEVRREDIVTDDDGNFVSMSGPISIDFSLLINTLFWNFNGAVSCSVFGAEVANPGKTYPRAMMISVVLIALSYLVPLFGATAYNSPHWTSWEEGSLSGVSQAIGGDFLANWIVFATFCSNTGMYIAELFCDSFQILGMAECGLAPKFLQNRNKRFDTPHNAIFASLVIILFLIKFEFEDILGMTNALSAFYQLLIIAAFIKLRFSHPHIERPYKVPGSISVLVMSVIIPCGLLVYISVDVFFTLVPALLVAGFVVAGFAYAYWNKFTTAQFKLLRNNES
ncbi:Serine/threonine exchanger stet, partial [Globisporangium splendens]